MVPKLPHRLLLGLAGTATAVLFVMGAGVINDLDPASMTTSPQPKGCVVI
ncbi:Uncharacterised protein [Actinomyces bovis]|uniref:Uncharacterized protein n=1 Tax=Actinomyces bovis TaxID=1658 RepID=A0ABY1VQZ8_9ACTO|nr:hypothetical protein [Actinomyces bovis]SPT54172.1 Uncharacterised protein [Actinomyces bovis]VEG53551.1 Uncharacterised protein [Actinomyces israelii]